MQLTITPDNPLEWLALRANMVPWPLRHAQIMPVVAKAVLEAADRGVFDALANATLTADDVAEAYALHPKATRELLSLLTALGYLTYQTDRFSLAPSARKWMITGEPYSVQGMSYYKVYQQLDLTCLLLHRFKTQVADCQYTNYTLEFDELYGFCGSKKNKQWLWAVTCPEKS
jgi:Dimerisation domain